MSKLFEQGVLMGRFQHMHLQHEKIIDFGLILCNTIVILVGSAQKGGDDEEDIRNPFDVDFRMHLIEKVYGTYGGRVIIAPIKDTSAEDDVCYQWGLDFASKIHEVAYGGISNVDLMIYGNDEDRKGWFDFDDVRDLAKHMNHLIIAHEEDRISATKVRNHLYNDEYAAWAECVNPILWNDYADIRKRMLSTKVYRAKETADYGTGI